MSRKPKISGFTLVRNAITLDYPFEASVQSLLPFCDELVINCGDSTDGTVELCESLRSKYPDKIRVTFTTWEDKNQAHGIQLSRQTQFALDKCQGDWCFYLQADEVLHETDSRKILEAITKADSLSEIDGIHFDYLHFYTSFDYLIRGRNWYRGEVRAFKNHRGIESFRDAQGFRKKGQRLKAIASGARVFHYGYVRSPNSVKQKSIEMSKWWGVSPVLDPKGCEPKNHIGLSKFTDTHPQVMQAFIKKRNVVFDPKDYPRAWTRDELKNAVTILWEKVFPVRIGEYRNYDIVS